MSVKSRQIYTFAITCATRQSAGVGDDAVDSPGTSGGTALSVSGITVIPAAFAAALAAAIESGYTGSVV